MGQYYIPYIENEAGRFTLYSHDYGSGLKLMEHSYMGNDFVNAVVTMIDIDKEGKPSRIGWIGDYSNDAGVDPYLYEQVWRNDAYRVKPNFDNYFWDREDDPNAEGTAIGYGYFVNKDAKEFVDLAEYAPKVLDKWGYTINPLPLLTAIGNSLGGGDYHECYPHYEEVGRWYMDTIYFTMNRPDGMVDITNEVLFKEER